MPSLAYAQIERGDHPASAHAEAGARRELVDSIPHANSAGSIARDLQRYIVQVPRWARSRFVAAGAAHAIEPEKFENEFVIADNDALYSDGAGLHWDEPTYRDEP